jgi:hypothetical protein
MLATYISEVEPLHAVGLWIAVAFASARLPRKPASERWRIALRCGLCLVPLTLVIGQAAYYFVESQLQLQEEAESNPYLNY